MDFSDMLLRLRRENGLTQKELAEKIEVAQASINYWEKRQRMPSLDAVQRLADYFNVSVDYLINGGEEQKTRSKIIPEKYALFLRKYHCLDEHGKALVDLVLDKEYERCENTPIAQRYKRQIDCSNFVSDQIQSDK